MTLRRCLLALAFSVLVLPAEAAAEETPPEVDCRRTPVVRPQPVDGIALWRQVVARLLPRAYVEIGTSGRHVRRLIVRGTGIPSRSRRFAGEIARLTWEVGLRWRPLEFLTGRRDRRRNRRRHRIRRRTSCRVSAPPIDRPREPRDSPGAEDTESSDTPARLDLQ